MLLGCRFGHNTSEDDMDSLEKLFEETTRDIYYAEKKILKALPKMARKAASPKLAAAFESHIAETEAQVERLDRVFELIGKSARGKTCPAIDGIIEEGEEIMKEAETDTVRDAGMLAAAQAVEHYEITRYGTLKSWAGKLGMAEAVELLDATLKEEKATDLKLTDLAESEINIEADAEGEDQRKRKAAAGRRR
jgi:ferritin-like metal-binding protein YciE